MASGETAAHVAVAAAAEPYMAAVVAQLVKDGIPATGYSIPPDPSPDDFDGEADGQIEIPLGFTTRHYGPDLVELCLWWNSVSGWRIHTQYDPNRPGDGRQWMGAGLLPPPARVSAFFAAMMVDHTVAGSPERPFYRRQGENVTALLERLEVYGWPASPGRP